MQDAPNPGRRHSARLGLAAFVATTLLVAAVASWFVARHRERNAAIAAIEELGGWVEYGPMFPDWIDRWGGDWLPQRLETVNLVYHYTDKGKRIEGTLATDEALPHVARLHGLRRLLLHQGQVTDKSLGYVKQLRGLEELFIWDGHRVGDAGVAHLTSLPRLRYLHLSNSRITDQSLRHLSTLPNLEGLALQGNRFTDQGLESLKDMKKLKQLVVGLGDTQITDAGLRYLKDLTQLEKLGLQRTGITDEGLRHLEGLTNLKELWLGQTAVTDNGISRIKRSLPGLTVRN